jgi:hypothetical protein
METTEKVRTLQAIYAGALADCVLRMGNEGVLEKVTLLKRSEQMAGGKVRAAQMGMTSPEEVFAKLSDLMGCANWTTLPNEGDGFTATASRCMLCAIAKKLGAQSPCRIYCLDPMEGMVKGLDENTVWDVQSTLYESSQCRVAVTPAEPR